MKKRVQSVRHVSSNVSMRDAFNLFWAHYFHFRGRSRPREFWFWYIWQAGFVLLDLVLMGLLGKGAAIFIAAVYLIATFFPNLTLLIRRMRDAGYANTVIAFILALFIIFTILSPASFVLAEDATIFGIGVMFTVCTPSRD